jgi:hypothetical protein
MFRKTFDELLEMLTAYEDILSKGFINEVNSCKKDPFELKKKLKEEYSKVSSVSFSGLASEHYYRRSTLVKILYTIVDKV